MWRMGALALLLWLSAASSADARRIALATYGEAATTCTITLFQNGTPFTGKHDVGGRTVCSAPLQQMAQAWLQDDLDGSREYGYPLLCSGVRTTCETALWSIESDDSK